MKVLSIVSGFVTNSSSVIHGFDASILQDERIKTLLSKYDVEKGFIGKELWNRGQCGSLLITDEDKREAAKQLSDSEYCSVNATFESGMVYVIYGDEYDGLAQEICEVMKDIAEEKQLAQSSWDYN